MFEKFYPNFYRDKVQDIDLDLMKSKNIKGFILDIDNTLVPMHVKEADQNAVKWIERVKLSGFKVCIVSNASSKRVTKFNENLGIYTIHRAGKPGTKSFLKASEIMGILPSETAVVGDQIFTDIYGGNRANMFTILVKPIDPRETIHIRAKRIPEKLVLAFYKKKARQF